MSDTFLMFYIMYNVKDLLSVILVQIHIQTCCGFIYKSCRKLDLSAAVDQCYKHFDTIDILSNLTGSSLRVRNVGHHVKNAPKLLIYQMNK